ncbi:MAG: hypothetical protein ABI868_24075 [Acidobacteriota bacterium]
MSDIDEKTVEYVLENRKHFEDLRQVTAQLAGLLVLAATGSRSASPDHPLLESANGLFQEAVDGLRSARVPIRARPHHDAIMQAVTAVRHALDAAQRSLGRQGPGIDVDPILIPLQMGYAHLQRAAQALPGFEMIAFDQGCCGAQRSAAGPTPRPGLLTS